MGKQKMTLKLRLLVFVLCASTIGGCATVTSGSKDVLVVESIPGGAQVQTSNGLSCVSTPCSLKMKKRSDISVTVSKDGCKTVVANVTHKTSSMGAAGIAGNVILGGGIGLGIDAITGASQMLTPNPVVVTLQCSK